MQKIWENNGTEEIGLVTPTPGNLLAHYMWQLITWKNDDQVDCDMHARPCIGVLVNCKWPGINAVTSWHNVNTKLRWGTNNIQMLQIPVSKYPYQNMKIYGQMHEPDFAMFTGI